MICSPCGDGRHNGCRWPASCPCHHRDPAAELVAETAANARVDRARVLAGGPGVREPLPPVPEWLRASYRKIAPPHLAALLMPQTGPLVPRIIDHHVA